MNAAARPRRLARAALVPGGDLPAARRSTWRSALAVPIGHGHYYAPQHYIDAWVAVTDAAGLDARPRSSGSRRTSPGEPMRTRRGRDEVDRDAASPPSPPRCCSRSAATRSAATPAGRCRGSSRRRSRPSSRPFYRVTRPDGPGPFPTALLFSGCDGPKDNLERWARDARRAEGWASIIVDSHGPRGFSDYEVWRLVCAGQLFMGSERAGDVLVAIDDARRMRFVDPEPHRARRRVARRLGDHGPAWRSTRRGACRPTSPRCPPARRPTRSPASPARSCSIPTAARPTARGAAAGRRPIPTLFLLSADDSDRALGLLRRHRRAPERRRPAGAGRALRRRDPRLRPAGPLGAQPARVRPRRATAEAMAIARRFLEEDVAVGAWR